MALLKCLQSGLAQSSPTGRPPVTGWWGRPGPPALASPGRGPAGTGRVAAVARTDVIDAAAAVLADPGAHEDRACTLTGPEALTMTEAARIMSEATGEDYRFQDETLEQARASRAGYGAPEWELEAWISPYTAIAAGELAEVTDDVERLTGHPPLSLEQVMSGRRIA